MPAKTTYMNPTFDEHSRFTGIPIQIGYEKRGA